MIKLIWCFVKYALFFRSLFSIVLFGQGMCVFFVFFFFVMKKGVLGHENKK